MSDVVYIARCPEHGLHGEREQCFVCGGDVEKVPMVEPPRQGERLVRVAAELVEELAEGLSFTGNVQLVGDELHFTWPSAPVSVASGGDELSGGEGSRAPVDPTADADEPGSGEGGDTAVAIERTVFVAVSADNSFLGVFGDEAGAQAAVRMGSAGSMVMPETIEIGA